MTFFDVCKFTAFNASRKAITVFELDGLRFIPRSQCWYLVTHGPKLKHRLWQLFFEKKLLTSLVLCFSASLRLDNITGSFASLSSKFVQWFKSYARKLVSRHFGGCAEEAEGVVKAILGVSFLTLGRFCWNAHWNDLELDEEYHSCHKNSQLDKLQLPSNFAACQSSQVEKWSYKL